MMGARVTLGGLRRDLVRAAFVDYFGIGGARADVLIALFERQGEPAKSAVLANEVNRHRRPQLTALWESIFVLRSCMAAEAIDRSDEGFWLSEVGLAECRKALEIVGHELLVVAGSEAA